MSEQASERPEPDRAAAGEPEGQPGAEPEAHTEDRLDRRDAVAIAVVFSVAFAARLLYLHQAWDLPFFESPIVDAKSYDDWGLRIADGDWLGDQTFYQAPAYPYFLGVVYSLFGHDLWMLRVVQILLGAAASGLLYAATRAMFGRPAAWAAGLLIACYAPAIFFDGLIQKTSLGLFLTSLLLLSLVRFVKGPRLLSAVGCGCVLGLLALTRENALAFAFVIPAWLAISLRRRPGRLRVQWALAFALGLALVLTPVGLRNGLVGESFTITTSQLGPNFYIGNNAHATGLYQPLVVGRQTPDEEGPDARRLAEWELGRTLGPGEVSRFWLSESLAWIRSDPGAWLQLTLQKALLTLNDYEIPDTEDIYVNAEFSQLLAWLAPILRFGVLLPLGLAGMLFAWRERGTRRERDAAALVAVMAFVFAGAVAAFYVWARYRFPLVPLLIPFAGLAIARTLAVLWNEPLQRLLAPSAVALLAAVVANLTLVDRNAFLGTAWTNLGIIMLDAQRLDEAEDYLLRSAAIDPGGPDIQYQLGVLRFRQARYELAKRHLARAESTDPRANRLLAEVLRRQGRAGAARRLERRARALDPEQRDGAGAHAPSQRERGPAR